MKEAWKQSGSRCAGAVLQGQADSSEPHGGLEIALAAFDGVQNRLLGGSFTGLGKGGGLGQGWHP